MTDAAQTTIDKLLRVLSTTGAVLGLTLLSHVAAGVGDIPAVIAGLCCLGAIVVAGFVLTWATGDRLPPLVWVSAVAVAAGFPGVPGAAWVLDRLEAVNFVATITPVLAFAALGLRQGDVDSFRRNGVTIAVVAVFVFFGTFIGSALVAQLAIVAAGV
ncbi:MAG: hypothetical protein AAGC56_06230 [Pseudomonadota bacterium]